MARTAELLRGGPALVYLAPGLSTEAQRAAIALADAAGARLDSVTSDTGAPSILVGQRRGRATATLGEIRRRADLIVFWGVDPAERYPRYRERYTGGGATIVAVDVGGERGPADAAERFALPTDTEAAALGVMRATIMKRPIPDLAAPLAGAAALAERMAQARYVAIVHDAEPARTLDPQRAEGLTGLAQALNVPTRCALSSLRGGGNRSGADTAITWQTGFPFAVDFTLGVPRYRPDEPASEAIGAVQSVLVAGETAALPSSVARGLGGRHVVAVGPRASEAPFPVEVAIDTGIAGIHEGGIAYRLDEVPLPLTPALVHPRSAAAVLDELARALARPAAVR
jgi:formylmethanofuran dehydrogenase subunit B